MSTQTQLYAPPVNQAFSLSAVTIEKFRSIYRTLSAKFGDFNVFGLFSLEDSPGRWELWATAPWIAADVSAARSVIIEELFRVLDSSERMMLAAVIFPVENNPVFTAMSAIGQLLTVDRQISIRSLEFNGVAIHEAIIFRLHVPNEGAKQGGVLKSKKGGWITVHAE